MKRHENIIASLFKSMTATERAVLRHKGNIRRSSLENGVIRVHYIKLLSPHCEIGTCTAEANYHYNGGQYCAQHRPAPDYADLATCADCGRSYYQADGEECQCHNCWAASLTPPSPTWDAHPPICPPEPGQCVECGLPCEPGFFLHNECLKPIHFRYFQEGA